MKLGIISDTHNNEEGTLKALKTFQDEGVQELIHCGDLSSWFMAELFKGFCIHHVLGNNDFDRIGISISIQECVPGSSSGEVYTGMFGKKTVAAVHGHIYAQLDTLINQGNFDYVFQGHTHRQTDEMVGKTRLINPGAIGGAMRGPRGYCILDVEKDDLTFYRL